MAKVEEAMLGNYSYLAIVYFVCLENSLLSNLINLLSVNFRSDNTM